MRRRLHGRVHRLIVGSRPRGPDALERRPDSARRTKLFVVTVATACALCACPARDPLAAHHLAAAGDTAGLQRLLRAGYPIDARSSDGVTALMIAASYDRADTLRFLLSAGGDPLAVDEDGKTALQLAAMFGASPRVLQVLLDAGLPIDGVDRSGRTPLGLAAMADHIEPARYLLSQGGDPHGARGQRRTPLLLAASHGAHMTTLLLGADPGGWAPDELRAPLIRAAAFDRADTIEVLLEAGAPIDGQDDRTGGTALHAAAGANAWNAIRSLLDGGADPQVRDRKGQTPIELAREMGDTEAARLLESEGPRPTKH